MKETLMKEIIRMLEEMSDEKIKTIYSLLLAFTK